MEVVKALIATLVMPLPVALLLAVLGTGALIVGFRRAGTGGVVVSFLIVFVASWGPMADGLLAPLEQRHPPVLEVPDNAGLPAVVVLGYGGHANGGRPVTSQLHASAAVRLMEGIRLYRALPDARLVLPGGTVGGDPSSMSGYAEAALALGVPEDDIVMLGHVTDTADEATAVRRQLEPDQGFYLVTSASHMHRAFLHFRAVGLDPTPAPTRHKALREKPDELRYWVPNAEHLRKTERALYEYMGLVSLRLDHW